MDYSSLLYTPGPDAARMAAPQPAGIPQTATPQYPPIPISYPVANPQDQVQGPAPIPGQGMTPAPAQPAEPIAAPPANPGLWEKFQTNPNLMQAALMSGLRLMHGQQNGQDTFGLVSDALMAGNLAYQYNQQNAVEDERKAAELQSQLDYRGAQTAQTKQKTSQEAELFPQTKARLEQEVRNLTTQGRKAEADALKSEFEADPKRMAEKWSLDRNATRANINQSNAAAGASGAAAEASRALTTSRKRDQEMREIALDPNATEDQKKRAREYFAIDDKASIGTQQRTDALKVLIKEANPTWTDQQVAAELLSSERAGKVNYVQSALKILENPSDYDSATVDAAKAVVGGGLQEQAKRMAGGKQGTAPTGDVKTISEADIQRNMKKYNWTREKTLQKAAEQGYTLEGAK